MNGQINNQPAFEVPVTINPPGASPFQMDFPNEPIENFIGSVILLRVGEIFGRNRTANC
jgi:hypothetical protein